MTSSRGRSWMPDFSYDVGTFFRSEEMELTQLFLQPDVAFDIIASLGEAGVAQFVDLNEGTSAFQRKFVDQVKNCNEMERKLKYIETELSKENLFIAQKKKIPKTLNKKEMDELEIYLTKVEQEVRLLSDNNKQLQIDHIQMQELREVLTKANGFFNSKEDSNILELIQGDDAMNSRPLDFIAGVIDRERLATFERVLWRVGRGNIFVRQDAILKPFEDPDTGKLKLRTVFVAFYQGEQLRSRIKKICHGFKVDIYKCPTSNEERAKSLTEVERDIKDLEMVLLQTQAFRSHVLRTDLDKIFEWTLMVRKVKAIYYVMNMFNFDISNKCFIAECWVSKVDIQQAQTILADISKSTESTLASFINVIDTRKAPPTYIRTNKFTSAFQNLIESYGILSYQEVNPGIFTIVTFPFLFAVMFGDLGHGFILFVIGALLCYFEKKFTSINSEIFQIFFSGRYIILLMGLYSMYTGLVYNDLFSKSMNIFGSQWKIPYDFNYVVNNPDGKDTFMLAPEDSYLDEPYPIGMDPIWMQSKNKIIFHNSYKMKMSIIIGVVHMIFGLSLSVVNSKKLKRPENIWFEFVPQVIFLICLFAWLTVMMFVKWVQYSAFADDAAYRPHCAPSVLILFINMMLMKGYEPEDKCKEYFFDYQNQFQLVLLVVGVLCIPVMLVGKPIYLMKKQKQEAALKALKSNLNHTDDVNIELYGKSNLDEAEEHNEPASELFLHQGIHTIEYVLSTISHTASYLRLWALSLAHGELSDVLYKMVFSKSFMFQNYMGVVTVFIIFGIWSFLTFFILVMMEGLSAFLHTLRLHWVEFMNKFFEGAGHPFQPFCFKIVLDNEAADELMKAESKK